MSKRAHLKMALSLGLPGICNSATTTPLEGLCAHEICEGVAARRDPSATQQAAASVADVLDLVPSRIRSRHLQLQARVLATLAPTEKCHAAFESLRAEERTIEREPPEDIIGFEGVLVQHCEEEGISDLVVL